MKQENKKYQVVIPIIKSCYNKTKSAKFKGNLFFVSNQHGIIYDWKIKFSELEIDLYLTKSIFDKKGSKYNKREKLFKQLNFKQLPRPNKKSFYLKKIQNKQLEIANNYFNDRDNYKSTLKNILLLIKGSNPSGEATNPKNAELIINNTNSINNINNKTNFVILFDHLTMKNKEDFDAHAMSAKDISIQDFFSLNKSLKHAFNFMQKSKNKQSWQIYLEEIKNYYKKYNNYISKANKIANKARNQFNKIVEKEMSNDILPFGFESSAQFQKAHIYQYHDLRDEIVQSLKEGTKYDQYVKKIKDYNNFIPIQEAVHRQFDKNFFTYNLSGEMIILQNNDKIQSIQNVLSKYKQINKKFLNKQRKKNFLLRNEKLNIKQLNRVF